MIGIISEAVAQVVGIGTVGAQPVMPELNEHANVWAIVMVNLFTTLPATIAAIGALIVSIRNSNKQDVAAQKQDLAAQKATIATKAAAAAVVQAESVVAEAKDAATLAGSAAQHAERVMSVAEDHLSTAAEDAKRAAEAVAEIKAAIEYHAREIMAAIQANRPTRAVIKSANEQEEQ